MNAAPVYGGVRAAPVYGGLGGVAPNDYLSYSMLLGDDDDDDDSSSSSDSSDDDDDDLLNYLLGGRPALGGNPLYRGLLDDSSDSDDLLNYMLGGRGNYGNYGFPAGAVRRPVAAPVAPAAN